MAVAPPPQNDPPMRGGVGGGYVGGGYRVFHMEQYYVNPLLNIILITGKLFHKYNYASTIVWERVYQPFSLIPC